MILPFEERRATACCSIVLAVVASPVDRTTSGMSPKAPLAATRAALSGRHSISLAEGSKTSAAHTFGELRRLTRWRGTLIKKELLGVASLRNCGHNRNSRDMEVSRGAFASKIRLRNREPGSAHIHQLAATSGGLSVRHQFEQKGDSISLSLPSHLVRMFPASLVSRRPFCEKLGQFLLRSLPLAMCGPRSSVRSSSEL